MAHSERPSLWEKVAHNLQEWYDEAVSWSGEKARIGVKKMDILGVQHSIKRGMTHLGGRVYDLMRRNAPVESDAQVQEIVANLGRLEEELASRERELGELRAGRRSAEDRAGK